MPGPREDPAPPPSSPTHPPPPTKQSPFINAIWRQRMQGILAAMRKGSWEGMPTPQFFSAMGITILPLTASVVPHLARELAVFEKSRRPGNRPRWRDKCFESYLEPEVVEDDYASGARTMVEVLAHVHGLSEFYWDGKVISATVFPEENPHMLTYKHKKCHLRHSTSTTLVLSPTSQPANCHTLAFTTLPKYGPDTSLPPTDVRITELYCLVAMATYAIETLATAQSEHITRLVVVRGRYVRAIKAVFPASWLRDLHGNRNLLRGEVRMEVGGWKDWEGRKGRVKVLRLVFEEMEGFGSVREVGGEGGGDEGVERGVGKTGRGQVRTVNSKVNKLKAGLVEGQGEELGKLAGGVGHAICPLAEGQIAMENGGGVAKDQSPDASEQKLAAPGELATGKGRKRAGDPIDGSPVIAKKMRLKVEPSSSREEEPEWLRLL